MKKFFLLALAMLLMTAGMAVAADDMSWLTIGGDYRFRADVLSVKTQDYMQYNPSASFNAGPGPLPGSTMYLFTQAAPGQDVDNDSLYSNRFAINIKAQATEDVVVKARLLTYKVYGAADSGPVTDTFFSPEKSGIFDGNSGHTQQDNTIRADYAYATWSNVGGMPAWFSVGRRPSTGGSPSHLRQNAEKSGTAGVPSFLIDYAFDGMTIGVAPDIDALPGAYAKICYGRGYESGYRTAQNSLKDTDMIGINIVPYDTDPLHVELQVNRAFNMMSNPNVAAFGPVQANVGDIDQYGTLVNGKAKNLNWFVALGMSKTDPSDGVYSTPFGFIDTNGNGVFDAGTDMQFNGNYGLLWDDNNAKESRTGSVIYVGARYDIDSTKTKIGAEYNRGSKNWIAFAPASDDIIASKLGTRGQVYEFYVIQELNQTPVSKKGKAFFRLGYQYYDFEYTGSNGWLGAPVKISELNTSNPMTTQLYAPAKTASNIYASFDVQF